MFSTPFEMPELERMTANEERQSWDKEGPKHTRTPCTENHWLESFFFPSKFQNSLLH